ncbi:MAG: putative toxin-antitoxin system toxin component, PIN family [Prevotella sp.]|nr:putative toxin-antitoxin system toxin component, PIN family [Prevotella sp.]
MPVKSVKIIIDTNLWISFLIGMKSSLAIRRILTDGAVSVVMTDILQAEIMAVASRPKFTKYFAPEACDRLLEFLRARSDEYVLGDIPNRCRDPKDDYLLELARVSDADILVTGDKDLTDMRQFGRCQMMTLAEFKRKFL